MHRRHDMPFGASLDERGTCRFRFWAPAAQSVELLLGEGDRTRVLSMSTLAEGWWERVEEVAAGEPYLYRIDGDRRVPDPAARAQAMDVHGPSLIINPEGFSWRDDTWRGRPWAEAVVYELHVGTFTEAGTFAGIIDRLDYLVSLGVTALEMMPIGDFPGARDWGYDGVHIFAPDRRYGTPDELKSLICAAHERGLMMLLDVVYNHFGPEGNYLNCYAPAFFTERHHTPWGAAINFDGEGSRTVRDFFIHNALYWLEEFHFDGLRLDAVHAILDDTRPDILDELAATVRKRFPQRHVHLILENDHNAAHYLKERRGKRAFDAQWNDDFHHTLHVITTAEEGGYYVDFAAGAHDLLARSLSDGFAFQGELSAYRGQRRGEPSRDLAVTAFVNFLQNHDQIGNRAFGERLASLTSPEALRAATVLLLLAPAPPLLFMGQEWGSVQPFLFFCDFGPELASLVTEGRRQEFADFPAFADPALRARIPDPQAGETFEQAVLRWSDADTASGVEWLALHRELLAIRRREVVPRLENVAGRDARALCFGEGGVAARWRLADRNVLLIVANLCEFELSDVALPAAVPIYATPGFTGPNDTLAAWGAAAFLTEEADATVRVAERVLLT